MYYNHVLVNRLAFFQSSF